MIKTAPITKIQSAAQSTDKIKATTLRGYSAALNRFKRTYSVPGGFCVSIKMVKSGAATKCMRCWHKEPNDDNMMDRLSLIAKAINDRRSAIGEYFIDYEKVDAMLDVDGTTLPGLIMDWIDGDTLEKFISVDNDKEVTAKDMRELAVKFREMCLKLNRAGISHGDLSGGNIIVLANPLRIKLIDYDSVYVESMGRLPETTVGDAKYQHPERKSHGIATLKADYFSQHLIYVTLLMLSRDMSLRTSIDATLFTQTDLSSLRNFEGSNGYRKGISMGDPEIKEELQLLGRAIYGRYLDVPPLKAAPEPVETPKPEAKLPTETPKPGPSASTPQGRSGFTTTNKTKVYDRFCTNCGKRFPSTSGVNAEFCTGCGHKRNYRYK